MKLIWKFNLVLLGIFVFGFLVAGYISYRALQENAREEILQNARLMMEAALSSRNYTTTQVKPLLETQMKYQFLPQTVPAYAATDSSRAPQKHPDYTYKGRHSARPTRNRAADWEADVVSIFRNTATTSELVGERDTPASRAYTCRVRSDQEQDVPRLSQHGRRGAQTMIDLYGRGQWLRLEDGRGDRRDRSGADGSTDRAREQDVHEVHGAPFAAVFVTIFVLLNIVLYTMVIRRVTQLAGIADQVSLGNMEAGEFKTSSKDEIGVLTGAMGRMKASLVRAMKMLEG
jgi:protein-histidine pros-kinase